MNERETDKGEVGSSSPPRPTTNDNKDKGSRGFHSKTFFYCQNQYLI